MKKLIIFFAVAFISCKSEKTKDSYQLKICNSIGCEIHTCGDYRIFDNTYMLYNGNGIGREFKEEITISNGYIVYLTPLK